jgi:hypothetical protein
MSASVTVRELSPIGLTVLRAQALYALWAGTSGDDLLLADQRGILVFRSLAALARFIGGKHRTNLSPLKGYRRARATADLRRSSVEWYRIDDAYDALSRRQPAEFDRRTCIKVVNALNLLWDAAQTLNDKEAEARLLGKAPLARLLDILTFYDPALRDPPAALKRLHGPKLAEDLALLVGRLILSSTLIV